MTEGVRRVALITGASRGVGASIATMLADRGFNVVINYHSKRSRAEDVAADVQARGGRALIVQADLTKSDETSAMVSTIGKTFGRLDAVVLNASGGLEKGKPPEYAMRGTGGEARTDLGTPRGPRARASPFRDRGAGRSGVRRYRPVPFRHFQKASANGGNRWPRFT